MQLFKGTLNIPKSWNFAKKDYFFSFFAAATSAGHENMCVPFIFAASDV